MLIYSGKRELLTRKVTLLLKVTDPARLQDAIAGITAGMTDPCPFVGQKMSDPK
jgi:hypothetical protein